MNKFRDQFDSRQEFGGLSIMKTWGVAALGGYIAACITLHPGDMPEYLIPSQERATIVFSTHGLSKPSSKQDFFPWEVKDRIENIAVIQSAILDTILEYEQREDFIPSTLSNKVIYAAIMASTLVWDNARPERLRLARSAASHLSKSSEVDLSPEIECLNLLLSDTQDPSSAKAQTQQVIRRRSEAELTSPALLRLFDICTFCGKMVTWQNLVEATCVAGHPYGEFFDYLCTEYWGIKTDQINQPIKIARCSLTFLTILEPGISKFCTRCNRAFLNEHIISSRIPSSATNTTNTHDLSIPAIVGKEGTEDDKNDNDNENDQKQGFSLADMLFQTYDTCPYCGGKFVG